MLNTGSLRLTTLIVAKITVVNHAGHEGGHYLTMANFTIFCVGR